MILGVQDANMCLRRVWIRSVSENSNDEWLLAPCIKVTCEASPRRRAQLVAQDENAATAKLNFKLGCDLRMNRDNFETFPAQCVMAGRREFEVWRDRQYRRVARAHCSLDVCGGISVSGMASLGCKLGELRPVRPLSMLWSALSPAVALLANPLIFVR
jgi:hypothetical protein